MSERAEPIQRPARPEAPTTAQRAASLDDPLLQMQAMLNRRPQVVAQAKFASNPATQSMLQTQAMLNQRPQVVAQARLATDLAARSRVAMARPVPGDEGAPVQAKFDWESNPHLAADPDVLPSYRVIGYQTAIKQAIDDLPDEADAGAVRDAAAKWLNEAGLAETYQLVWAGAQLYLNDRQTNQRIEFLGTYYDDQSNALYLPVPTAANLYVKKSDGTQWSRDSLGRYLPRFLTRSVDSDDTATLDKRDGLSARTPDGGGTKLEHVSGLRRSQYSSYTRSPNDVMNAQGGLFNAGGRGRVKIDLANIGQGNISDLSTPQGARGHLRASLNEWGKTHFDEIIAAAQEKAALELQRGPGVFAAAGISNPFKPNLPDSRWQAMVDIFRTQEVLIEGNVPHESVLDYSANTGDHVRQGRINDFRGAHQDASDLLTTAAGVVKAAHDAPLPIDNDLTGILATARIALNLAATTSYRQRRPKGVENRERDTRFKTAMTLERDRLVAELRELAQAFQHRRADNWPNTTAGDFQNLVTPRVQNAGQDFDRIAVPT